MRLNSYGNENLVWEEPVPGTKEGTPGKIFENVYGKPNPYSGPDNPSEYEKINDTHIGADYYMRTKYEWERWIIYKELKKEGKALPSDRSLDYLIPLDMSISLQAVKNL
jgi:hypothetical protein